MYSELKVIMDFADKIVEKLGLDPNFSIKKAIRGYSGITTKQLIEALINTDSIGQAATLLGYSSEGPVKTSISKVLIPLFPNRKNVFGVGGFSGSWKYTLLASIKHKYCSKCSKILPINMFGTHTGNSKLNISSECSRCHIYRTKLQKIDIANRTPIWANMDKIQEIYCNCPDGYHVDHIVPLRGNNVSGLHVEYNLQYLTAEQNLIKSNSF